MHTTNTCYIWATCTHNTHISHSYHTCYTHNTCKHNTNAAWILHTCYIYPYHTHQTTPLVHICYMQHTHKYAHTHTHISHTGPKAFVCVYWVFAPREQLSHNLTLCVCVLVSGLMEQPCACYGLDPQCPQRLSVKDQMITLLEDSRTFLNRGWW